MLWLLLTPALAADPVLDLLSMHLQQEARHVDHAGLEARYTALCEGGHPLACKWRAWDDLGLPRQEGLRRVVGTFCEQGDQVACTALAWSLGQEPMGSWSKKAQDLPRAVELLQEACQLDQPRACADLGTLYALGLGVHQSEELAQEKLEAACASGVGQACLRLAEATDEDRASWLEKAAATRDLVGRWRLAVERSAQGSVAKELCAEGVVGACAFVAKDGLISDLERSCWLDLTQCERLAEARREAADLGPRGELKDLGNPDQAVVAGGGVLLGWRTARYSDHVLIPMSELLAVELAVDRDGHEVVELALPAALRVLLPWRGCEEINLGVHALSVRDELPRAISKSQSLSTSQCLERAKEPYLSGGLQVASTENPELVPKVREALVKGREGMIACWTEHHTDDRAFDPIVATVVAKRSKELAKVKMSRGSGVEAFDQCIIDWIQSTELEEPPDVSLKVEVELQFIW